MKILIRKFDDKYYVWKDATYFNGEYFIKVDNCDLSIHETMILAVADDDRNGKVVCNYCGELIDNTPEAIEKHFVNREASAICLKCDKCKPYGEPKNKAIEYTSNGDGTYHAVTNEDVQLACKMLYYGAPDINSDDAKKICQFRMCRKHGVKELKDFFITYPGAFDTQITVDFLMKKGFAYTGYYSGYFWYDLKLRGALYALVNEAGIVERFSVKHKDRAHDAYYSHKYKKLFFDDYNRYNANTPSSMSVSKHENATAKIAALYEEATK